MFSRSIRAVKTGEASVFCDAMPYAEAKEETDAIVCWNEGGLPYMAFSYEGDLHVVKTEPGSITRKLIDGAAYQARTKVHLEQP